ncbi:MAG TPA: rhomboid family intramembrane serine protease [Candidatus Limnocylindria bacterium]|nr:rhomboid family intramembrane serine protease [Candidatus Limnocylindria bacterium]
MIPLRDENRRQTVPIVTYAIIVINSVVYLYQLGLGPEVRSFVMLWGLVPLRLTSALEYGTEPMLVPGLTVISSMFMHGSWLHLLGNMWYLWIFGDNIEDRMGRLRFVVFYLLAGAAAAALHYVLNRESRVPSVGASGAIAGVLGAYAFAFPSAKVITLVPLFPFFQIMAIPAVVMLGLWFVYQFLAGFLTSAWSSTGHGVAWWAHIGGFAFGGLTFWLFAAGRPRSRATVV